MNKFRLIMVVCLLMTGAICSDAKVNATNAFVKTQVEKSDFKTIRTISVGTSVGGVLRVVEGKYKLVEDKYSGKLYVECTSRSGKKYYPVFLCTKGAFKYGFYVGTYLYYFN